MTVGNRVEVPTPGMPSLATGGPDPAAGKGFDPANSGGTLAVPLIGADDGPSSTNPGDSTFGTDRSGNNSMQDMGGTLTLAAANEAANGSVSMMDMSGPRDSTSPKPMNTSGDKWSYDNTGNPMRGLESTETYC